MAYIKIDKDLADDWRVLGLANVLLDEWVELGLPEHLRDGFRDSALNCVTGGIFRLWRYADTHLKRYDRLKAGVTQLPAVTGLSTNLLRKFPPEWLVECRDGTVRLPGYSAKNAISNKDIRREKTRERVRAWRRRERERKSGKGNADVTPVTQVTALPPGPGPGPGPGPSPPRPGPGPGPAEEALARGPLAPLAQGRSGGHALTPPANLRDNSPRFPPLASKERA